MIHINLLPEAYRKPERTSPKVFAAALVGVIAVCSSLGWFGMVYFGDLDKVVVRNKEVEETLRGVKTGAQRYAKLVQEEKEFSKRSATVKSIAKGRMLWTKFMDEFITVISNDTNYQRHVAWFNSIQVRGSRDNRKGPSLVLPGAVQGADFSRIANLLDDVGDTEFFKDIVEFSPPSGVKKIDAGLFPPESYTFSWKGKFKAPDQWAKNQAPAPKPKKKK